MSKNSFLKRLAKKGDIYAKPIELTFKGNQEYKTTLGGFISLVTMIFVIIYLGYNLRIMFKRENTQIKKNTLTTEVDKMLVPEYLSEKNFTFAFRLSDYLGQQNMYDEKIAKVIVSQRLFTYTSEGYDIDFQVIDFSPC